MTEAQRDNTERRSQAYKIGETEIRMTNIDPRSDIGIFYQEDNLTVMVPLTSEITEMWRRRYEALARAKGLHAQLHNREGTAFIHLAVPVQTEAGDVLKMLDTARDLIAEADAAEQSPAASNSPEAIARQWWARQQT
jgi:hypothetical protein